MKKYKLTPRQREVLGKLVGAIYKKIEARICEGQIGYALTSYFEEWYVHPTTFRSLLQRGLIKQAGINRESYAERYTITPAGRQALDDS